MVRLARAPRRAATATPAVPRDSAWDRPLWRRLGWSLVALQIAGCALVIPVEGWGGAAVLAMFAGLSAAALWRSPPLPTLLALLFAATAAANAAGWIWRLYDRIWWYDDILHVLMPLAVVGAVLAAAARLGWIRLASPGRFVALAAAMGLVLGLAWEGLEALFIVLTWPDTLLDLAYDTAGAALAGSLVWRGEPSRSQEPQPAGSPAGRWLSRAPAPRPQRG